MRPFSLSAAALDRQLEQTLGEHLTREGLKSVDTWKCEGRLEGVDGYFDIQATGGGEEPIHEFGFNPRVPPWKCFGVMGEMGTDPLNQIGCGDGVSDAVGIRYVGSGLSLDETKTLTTAILRAAEQ